MDRRAFIAGSLALLAAPLVAGAQPTGKVYKIGYLTLGSSFAEAYRTAFYESLREHDWIESQNFVLVSRYAQGQSERLPELVAELAQLKVDVLVVGTTEAALAAKRETRSIPIVAVTPADAVAVGLVASLARPGGNVTGLSFLGTELTRKQLELLKEAVPNPSAIAILSNPDNASHPPRLKEANAAAQRLGVRLEFLEARTPSELEKAFVAMTRKRVGGILVLADPMFVQDSGRLAQLASKGRFPVMYGQREHVVAGGLMAYGPLFTELYRRAAVYVDKILKGAKPADLPVEQPTKFELVINLKTAKALGLTIPPSVLARADEVIQ